MKRVYNIPGFPHYTIDDDMVVISTRGRQPKEVGNENRVGLYGITYGKARLLWCAKRGINPKKLPEDSNIVFTKDGVTDRRTIAENATLVRMAKNTITEPEQRQRLATIRRRCDDIIKAIDTQDFSVVIDEIMQVANSEEIRKMACGKLHRHDVMDTLHIASYELIGMIVKSHIPIPNYENYIQKLCMKIRNKEIKNRKLYGYEDNRLRADKEPEEG